jgi:hypothetical protein
MAIVKNEISIKLTLYLIGIVGLIGYWFCRLVNKSLIIMQYHFVKIIH